MRDVAIDEIQVGERYVDKGGREFEVTELNRGDRLGREIVGLVSHSPRNGHAPQPYSCDQLIFAGTWRLP